MPKKQWKKRAQAYDAMADLFKKLLPSATREFKQKAKELRNYRGRKPKVVK